MHIRVCGRVLALLLRCRSQEFAKNGGFITVRHSRVRPTFHSAQCGLSTYHQPTMAGHEQSKTSTMEMTMRKIFTSALVALSVLSGTATLANAASGEEFGTRTTAGQQGSPN